MPLMPAGAGWMKINTAGDTYQAALEEALATATRLVGDDFEHSLIEAFTQVESRRAQQLGGEVRELDERVTGEFSFAVRHK